MTALPLYVLAGNYLLAGALKPVSRLGVSFTSVFTSLPISFVLLVMVWHDIHLAVGGK